MFRALLLPLDGSALAESALPVAATLARRLGARVDLLHVLERHSRGTVHGQPHLTQRAEAEGYLETVLRRLLAEGVSARALLRTGDADLGGSIAACAAELGSDLIVLCSHGTRGVRGLLFGRVAQQVLCRGSIPVLLVPAARQPREQPYNCGRILAPLDGSRAAEAALPASARLTSALGAELLLVRVVPTVGTIPGEEAVAARLMPSAAAALLDEEAAAAAKYLQEVSARLRAGGLPVQAVVGRGDPAQGLLDVAAGRQVDLVALATHGRAGVAAVWAGSVVAKLVERSRQPMLLIRAPAAGPTALPELVSTFHPDPSSPGR
ncbi:MAG: universal stress protein [Gemmatimonadetes bacterium]|nr:universal stress protein [Gemmatimonadota bacterium]